VLGYDFYKECIARGSERVRDLGPVLGAYHPVSAYNIRRLLEISGLDQISFHMSGTEAVMQAVRLARYNTGRTHLVRFCGAYHGWWGDVQPGVGNPIAARETYTLNDMSEAALRVLRTRRDIACVLVNPLQALHPNSSAPGDYTLVDSGRQAHFDRAAYAAWLAKLRAVCSERGIALIFDEVFVGFRISPRGAQEYFGVEADMVTYGKTVAGGLPVGVLCGPQPVHAPVPRGSARRRLPGPGTFNAPSLRHGLHVRVPATYRHGTGPGLVPAARTPSGLAGAGAQPAPAGGRTSRAGRESVFDLTICYRQPSRYNWMFQYYLRAAGLSLSWVGTAG